MLLRNSFWIAVVVLFVQPLAAQTTASISREMQTAVAEDVGMSTAKLEKVIPALQELVDDHVIPGAVVIVARRGHIVLHDAVGWRDVDADKPMETDSIMRFYSMTKAVTSVSIMMLVEQGKIGLDDAVSKYVPELAGIQVFAEKSGDEVKLVDAEREMTIRDLLRHTSGLTYGFFGDSYVDRVYMRDAVLDDNSTLQDMAGKLGKLPLLYQPGNRFNYSVSSDLLGHVIEVVSGQPLDQFFARHVFEPLEMQDTAFHVPPEKVDRFANNYGPRQTEDGIKVIDHASDSKYLKSPKLLSGGGGLVSTSRDYMRFCQMLLNKGTLDDAQLLQPATIEQMTTNQLPDSAYPMTLNGPREGVGFGLGFSVVMEITEWTKRCRIGEYGWGGAASTHFWISPNDELAVVVLTQYMPFNFRLENTVKPLVYDAIVR